MTTTSTASFRFVAGGTEAIGALIVVVLVVVLVVTADDVSASASA